MAKKTSLPYRESTWFCVPAASGAYALGVAARIDGKGTVFGYFFGPPHTKIPDLSSAQNLRAEDAVLCCLFGDLGLIKGDWIVLGEVTPWDRGLWPLPTLIRVSEEKAWLVEYGEDLTWTTETPCSPELKDHYPRDGLYGSKAVENVLSSRLGQARKRSSETLHHRDASAPAMQQEDFRVADEATVTIFSELVESLLNDLERISETHGEVTDTVVGESVHLTLSYFFVWGKEGELPVSYRMFSAEGDRAVADAVERFLTAARASPELSAVPLGRARLELLQNEEISTPGGLMYDDFLGHVDNPLPPDPLPRELYEVRENR